MIFTPYPRSGYNYRYAWEFQDDIGFGESVSGRIGTLGWNGSGTFAVAAATTNRPGQLNVSTGGSSGTVARINGFGNQVFSQAHDHRVLFHLKLNSNDANTTVRIGSSDGWASNPASNMVMFEKLDADTNWFCVTRAGGVQTGTRIDSGVATNTTNFVTFEYQKTPSGVAFYIDGVFIVNLVANIPTALAGFGFHIRNNEALAKTLDWDYVEGGCSGLVRI